MKTSRVVGMVAVVHVVGIGALLLSQGCGTRQPRVEPPPVPVMPPSLSPAPAPVRPPPPAPIAPMPRPLPEEQLKTYEVRPGDSLGRIAQRYGVSVNELVELNQLENPNRIRVGQKILLPAHAREREPVSQAPAAPRATPQGAVEYRVMPGDSLSRIAQRYGVKVAEIMEANGLGSDRIRAGQKLIIPHPRRTPSAPAPSTPATPSTPSTGATAPTSVPAPRPPPVSEPAPNEVPSPLQYTVQEGDTLETIAASFSVSVESLRRLNNLSPDAEVRPGQRIRIPLSD